MQIYRMSDDEFLSLMTVENYAEFARTIKYFGFCMLVKMLTFRQMEKATAAGLDAAAAIRETRSGQSVRPGG